MRPKLFLFTGLGWLAFRLWRDTLLFKKLKDWIGTLEALLGQIRMLAQIRYNLGDLKLTDTSGFGYLTCGHVGVIFKHELHIFYVVRPATSSWHDIILLI